MGAKLCYTELEKMAYAVVMASRKLKHYFTAHPITIPTSYLLCDIFENREAVGRISKWAAKLTPYALSFVSRSTIKSQALADFIIDWMPILPHGNPPATKPIWKGFVDGAWEPPELGRPPSYFHHRDRRSTTPFIWTSPPPTMLRNMKHSSLHSKRS